MELFHGDCLEVMRGLPDKSVDCFICDLPYGCLTRHLSDEERTRIWGPGAIGKEYSNAGCAWDVPIDLTAFWTQVRRLARNDHTPVLMFCTTKFGVDLINSNPSWFRHDLVWDKQRGVSFLSANKMPLRSHEMVYVFAKKGAYYNRVDVSGTVYTSSGHSGSMSYGKKSYTHAPKTSNTRCILSVIQIKKVGTFKQSHPTEKPVTLYRWLLERYCPSGGAVLDPTFGSGNSGRAARELGLTYIGIEKDANFYAKARAALLGDEVADTIEHV